MAKYYCAAAPQHSPRVATESSEGKPGAWVLDPGCLLLAKEAAALLGGSLHLDGPRKHQRSI